MTLSRLGLDNILDRAVLSVVLRERIRRGIQEIVHDPAGSSLVVDRNVLDEVLIGAASLAGVEIVEGPGIARQQDDGGWRISVGPQPIRDADLLIDARGRRGLGARSITYGRGKVAAYYGVVQARGLAPFETIVGEGDGFWYWLIGLPDREVRIIALVAAATPRRGAPVDWIEAAIDACQLHIDGRIQFLGAKDATSRRARHPASDRLLRTGDAFMTVDPLSSSGLYVAALSAVQVSRLANTILVRPGDASMARRFYADAQADIARSLEEDGADHNDAFAPTPHNAISPSALPALSDLTLAPGFRLGETGVLAGAFIERRPVLQLSGRRGLAEVDGWPVERLLGPLMNGSSLLEGMRDWPALATLTQAKFIQLLMTEGVLVARSPQLFSRLTD